jgi:hypothetical protein
VNENEFTNFYKSSGLPTVKIPHEESQVKRDSFVKLVEQSMSKLGRVIVDCDKLFDMFDVD